MPVFPSVEWFDALKDLVNADESFRHQGTCDCVMGVRVGERLFKVSFEAYECLGAAETRPGDPEVDFALVLPAERWREMVENIKQHGAADLDHTLNALDLAAEDTLAVADDELRRDKFFRFNQSLQQYFDASAKLDTTFP